jgi:hypothetical protein
MTAPIVYGATRLPMPPTMAAMLATGPSAAYKSHMRRHPAKWAAGQLWVRLAEVAA